MPVLEEIAARGILAFVVPDSDAVGVTLLDEQGDQACLVFVVGFRDRAGEDDDAVGDAVDEGALC
jgi:hypothetical protein